jgi:hypothetical protein
MLHYDRHLSRGELFLSQSQFMCFEPDGLKALIGMSLTDYG